ncbi:hypothetical protein OBO34_19610 [Clostridiales Family XIII bacterium ASD5510]|uniref:YqbQ/XkdQ domain-containing protein n=1 Tax=Hominibacterium faecale TaxID=2839743 RepID=A0A9J6QYD6_9FIRM|nr:hypothetical protein [Hominibacterium faecale]MCU7380523.1 hypothetical protein [Hominibacterium faecale]
MNYVTPEYSVVIITANGTKYYVKKMGSKTSNIVISLTLDEPDGQLAQKAEVTLANIKIAGDQGGFPASLFKVKSRVFIYAKGAGKTKSTEVFRGFVWENRYSNKNEKEVTLTCYDHLIYLMKSETSRYFSKGKSTKTIMKAICKSWGIKLSYSYYSITHPKLPLSGTIADVIMSDILDKVKEKKGKKYVIRSQKDRMYIKTVGKNDPFYIIDNGGRGISLGYTRTTTMEDMVTKVIITGKTAKSGKVKVAAKVNSKNKKKYGTLQKVINKDEDTKLKTVKKEAKNILKENQSPKTTYEVPALDVPWLHKGDKVGVCFSGTTITNCIVKSITHEATEGTMMMEVYKI